MNAELKLETEIFINNYVIEHPYSRVTANWKDEETKGFVLSHFLILMGQYPDWTANQCMGQVEAYLNEINQ